MAGKVVQQHNALGAESPLRVLEEPNWNSHATAVTKATELQAEISKRERELKNLYGQRQQHLDVLVPTVRRTRDTLLGVYASNPRRLGDFGYDVMDSVAPVTKANAAKKTAAKKTTAKKAASDQPAEE